MSSKAPSATEKTLPVSFYANVIAGNRITIPTWISFIQPGDVIKGIIKLSPEGFDFFPFKKKVSVSRHITVGFIKSALKEDKLPQKLYVVIQQVDKPSAITEKAFNIFYYILADNNYELKFNMFKVEQELQFAVEEIVEEVLKDFLALKIDKTRVAFLQERYNENHNRWLLPIKLETVDDFNNRTLCLIVLVLDTSLLQEFKKNLKQIQRLLNRFQRWIYTVDDCNHETLSILSTEIKQITETGLEPKYYGVVDLFKLDDVERRIVQLLLTARRSLKKELSLEVLIRESKANEKEVKKTIVNLSKKGIILEIEKNIYTLTWHI